MNSKFLRTILAAAAVAIVTASAGAQTVDRYGSVTMPPGVYFGSGNPNNAFNIETGNGVELALRAKNRSNIGPVLIDGSTGVYHVPGTLCPAAQCGGTGTRARWNYEFSIHTTNPGEDLSDYIFLLGVDHDPSAGTAFSYVDPVNYWTSPASPTDMVGGVAVGVQDSQNVAFLSTPGGPLNPTTPGLYDFILLAFNAGTPVADLTRQNAIASVDITVQVPEPGSIALLGLGLAGLAAFGRRKLKKA